MKNSLRPPPSNPKSPDEEMQRNLSKPGAETMEWENEERILAPKSDISHDSSTFVGPGEYVLKRTENIKSNVGERVINEKTGESANTSTLSLLERSFSVSTEGRDGEQVHWEQPSRQTKHQHQE